MRTFITSLLFGILFLSACNKIDRATRAAATINVINTAIDIPGIKVNPSGGAFVYLGNTDSVKFGTNKFYFSPTNGSTITAVALADTTKKLFNMGVNLRSATYTMYVLGTSTAVDTMFKEETDLAFIRPDVIQPSSDSVVNVRFLNLSPNSIPVKIKIASSATNEVDNLPYKTIGNWKAYPAKAASTVYAFQVRNAATDALLATFNFTANAANRFKNVSLIIKGLQGTTTGTNAFGVFAVNYF